MYSYKWHNTVSIIWTTGTVYRRLIEKLVLTKLQGLGLIIKIEQTKKL